MNLSSVIKVIDDNPIYITRKVIMEIEGVGHKKATDIFNKVLEKAKEVFPNCEFPDKRVPTEIYLEYYAPFTIEKLRERKKATCWNK